VKTFHHALDEIQNVGFIEPPISQAADVPEVPESRINRDDTVSYSFLQAGLKSTSGVARLRVPGYNNGTLLNTTDGDPVIYLATGWLAAPDLVVTNYHVIGAIEPAKPEPSPSDLKLQALNTKVEFDYDFYDAQATPRDVISLDAYDKDLDYALLRLSKPLDRAPLRILNMRQEFLPSAYVAVNVIQHPFGGPKRVALRNNLIYDCSFPKLRYFAGTALGSSGAPVFNDNWQVIALHRASMFVEGVYFQGRKIGWVNEGTQMVAIMTDIEQKNQSAYHTIAQYCP
jgi:endonuclease G